MELAEYFARTIEDLRQRTDGVADEYSMLRASAMIRQLLTDGKPVAPRIAKALGTRLTFQVGRVHAGVDLGGGVGPADTDWSNPNSLGAPEETVDLPTFLARPIATIQSEVFTVRDVIRVVAHVHGGVHYGTPENEHEERLFNHDWHLLVDEMSVLHYSIQHIGRITVRALTPLAEAARARPGSFGTL